MAFLRYFCKAQIYSRPAYARDRDFVHDLCAFSVTAAEDAPSPAGDSSESPGHTGTCQAALHSVQVPA